MRLPHGFADEVRTQSDIVRVVSDYVTLKKRGANYLARCPFHSEKTPSFTVHPGKGIFKCFGCGAGGTVFDFIMRIDGCSFQEAVKIVAEKSGIPIPAVSESEDYKKLAEERETILRLNQWAAEFFESQLNDPLEGAPAREYVERRGISQETVERFRLGWAPDHWEALISHLRNRGAGTDELNLSGLAVLKEAGGLRDRFRGRLMFPICDSQGRVVAFGGRVIGPGEPKYLNSPETPVYTKGRNLFGLSLSKNEIRGAGFAILVEGYLDCMIPFQEGIRNIVASLGTALTDGQVKLLRRYMDQPQIVVNFDPDSAGQTAAMRSIDVLLTEGFKVNILRMPTQQDPDEFVREHGSREFASLLKTSQPYMDYVIDTAVATHDTSRPTGKVEAINAILPHLARMRDKVVRADYAEQIADRLKVDSRVVREELKRTATNRREALDNRALRKAEEVTAAERQLLALILASPPVRQSLLSALREEDYTELATASIFGAIVRLELQGKEADFDRLSELIESDRERELLADLLISDLGWAGGDDFDSYMKHATEALSSLRRRQFDRKLESIQIEISKAERERDGELVLRLYQEKTELQRRRISLSTAEAGRMDAT
jgi:DNA primase